MIIDNFKLCFLLSFFSYLFIYYWIVIIFLWSIYLWHVYENIPYNEWIIAIIIIMIPVMIMMIVDHGAINTKKNDYHFIISNCNIESIIRVFFMILVFFFAFHFFMFIFFLRLLLTFDDNDDYNDHLWYMCIHFQEFIAKNTLDHRKKS